MKRMIRQQKPSHWYWWKKVKRVWQQGLVNIAELDRDWRSEVRSRARLVRNNPKLTKLSPYQWFQKHAPRWQWRFDRLIAAGWIAKEAIATAIMVSKPGHLSWYLLLFLSVRNLRARWSRTVVTGGAIAVGICAIVFLVSFGYGLQDIVTKRLVHPNSLKLIDVQSDSTALQLNQESAEMMQQLPDVDNVARMVSLAGSFQIGSQKTEAVVIGTENAFLEYAYLPIIEGNMFSTEGNAPYVSNQSETAHLLALAQGMGQVAGDSDIADDVGVGDSVDGKSVTFRAPDETYVPVHETPSAKSRIIGYVRGSVVEQYSGLEVWGSSYQTSGTQGRAYRSQTGQWLGKWMKAEVPLWQESAATLYVPLKTHDQQQKSTGYIPSGAIEVLSQAEVTAAKLTDKVLGDMDDQSSESGDLRTVGAATAAAELQQLIVKESTGVATQSAQGGVISVSRKGGKEVIVSTGLLSLLKLEPKEVINKHITMTMIVSGGLIPGIAGRVLSEPVNYTIVGVTKDDERPVVYVPLGDVMSMGVDRFSLLKVLARHEDVVRPVRERIEAIGFMTQSLSDTLLQVERLFRVMRFLLGTIGAIALAVALLGMFNTLTISLMERTREIGVMKTLGTTNRDVVRLYLMESVVLGLLGGFVGAVAGIFMGEVIDIAFRFIRGGLSVSMFRTPPGLLFMMLTVSLFVGLFTGILPARRATKISALDALRYE